MVNNISHDCFITIDKKGNIMRIRINAHNVSLSCAANEHTGVFLNAVHPNLNNAILKAAERTK